MKMFIKAYGSSTGICFDRGGQFLQYGVAGAEPPWMEEQPVALATIILSPKSCVMVLM